MSETDDKVLAAMVAMQRSNPPAYTVFFQWLNTLLASQLAQGSLTKDEVETRWLQGRNQNLSFLIATMNQAEETLALRQRVKGDVINMQKVFD